MRIDLIGVPLDLGAGIAGADLGPRGLRDAGIVSALEERGHSVRDLGDLEIPKRGQVPVGDPKLRYLEPILAATTRLCAMTRASLNEGAFPLVIGGDHSYALGSIRGAAEVRSLGIIWVDAHGDFNTTETTPSGNIHGMPLAALAGLGDSRLTSVGAGRARAVDPRNMVLLGAREIDPGERDLLRDHGVTTLGMDVVRAEGFEACLARAIEIAGRGVDGIYLSFDLDGLDPREAPGVSTAVPEGLTVAQGLATCRAIAATGRLLGMDLVELNPLTDDAPKRTARLAVELAAAAC
jgi:arginase